MDKHEEITVKGEIRWEWVIIWEYKGFITYVLRPVMISFMRYY